jgi:riboflavin synthase
MFTGLVEEVGIITRVERRSDSAHFTVQARVVLEGTRLGDSIAVNGACLTVTALADNSFVVDAMTETLIHSTLGTTSVGTLVNLERSLALGERLGGHLVLGHVDAVGEVLSVRPEGIAQRVRMTLPQEVRGCVAVKGSIAVDGISLTVIEVEEDAFSVGIIPHTLKETTLGQVRAGVRVNLEADVLARYVRQTVTDLMEKSGHSAAVTSTGALTEELLREQGFA